MTQIENRALAQMIDGLALPANVEVLVGVDRVELDEFRRIVEAGGEHFLATVYTARELHHCDNRIEKLATRFAAKEATTKALGSGIRGVSLLEIEVLTSPTGQPRIELHDRARLRAHDLGIRSIAVSLTHTAVVAEAFVVALTDPSATHPIPHKEELP